LLHIKPYLSKPCFSEQPTEGYFAGLYYWSNTNEKTLPELIVYLALHKTCNAVGKKWHKRFTSLISLFFTALQIPLKTSCKTVGYIATTKTDTSKMKDCGSIKHYIST